MPSTRKQKASETSPFNQTLCLIRGYERYASKFTQEMNSKTITKMKSCNQTLCLICLKIEQTQREGIYISA